MPGYNPVGVDASNKFPTAVVTAAADAALKATTAALIRAAIGAASPADISTAIAGLVNSSPAALDTLNELAAALGNDANYAATVTAALGTKVTRPSGGIDGQVLVRSGSTVVWATVSGGSGGVDGGSL